ncbi:MAG: prohibitin family protein [Rhodospirillaceae bacterium]|nr:MAG: prohibitin family protein [Rhodospirillaceae bacterium]
MASNSSSTPKRSFWERHTIKVLLISSFLLIAGFLIVPRALVIVPAGHVGVVFSTLTNGTQTNPDKMLPEGLNIINPINRVFIYNARFQIKNLDVAALTSEGLNVKMQLSLRFSIERKFAGFLHQALGPKYIKTYLIPAATRIVLENVALKRAEDLYSNARTVLTAKIRRILLEDLRQISSNVAFKDSYILLNDVLIREIKLPELVDNSINLKETLRQTKEGYDFRLQIADLERSRKRVEAEGIQMYQRIIADSLTPEYLRYEGIKATLKLSESDNSKVIVIGADGNLPIILDTNSIERSKASKELGGSNKSGSSKSRNTTDDDPGNFRMEQKETIPSPNKTSAKSVQSQGN